MAVSEGQESAMNAARARESAQDKKNPFLIHIEDGRLLPHTKLLAKHPKLRVFTGDPKASTAERLAYLNGGTSARRAVVQTVEPFDVGKATKEQLIEFAATEFGRELQDDHLSRMRSQVMKWATEAAEALG